MAISKIILNGEVQMDVTSDTAAASNMLSGTKATKNDGTKVTGNIASKSSTDMTVSGATVTAPAGYYSSSASKSVATMTLPTSTSTSATSGYSSKATLDRSTSDRYINIPPGYNSSGGYYKINKVVNGSVTAPSSISGTSATVSTGTNTLTLKKSVSVTPNVTTAGYISSGTAGNSSVSLTASVTTKGAATITPSTSEQSIAAGTYLTGKQTIAAMPSGTAGTPTATKGTVSNHSVTVTPSVTNTTGYITGGTKTGTAVTVSASELTSGNKAITENGTGIDVTNYASVDVNVASNVTPLTVTPSNEVQVFDGSYVDGYMPVTVAAARLQEKTVTPSSTVQVVIPDVAETVSYKVPMVSNLNSLPLIAPVDLSFIEYGKTYKIEGYLATCYNEDAGNSRIQFDTNWTAEQDGDVSFTMASSGGGIPTKVTISKTEIKIYYPDSYTVYWGSIANSADAYRTIKFTCLDDSYYGLSKVTVEAIQGGASWIPVRMKADSSNTQSYCRVCASTGSSLSYYQNRYLTTSEANYYLPEDPDHPGWGILCCTSSSIKYWPKPTATSGACYVVNNAPNGSSNCIASWRIESGSVITLGTTDLS